MPANANFRREAIIARRGTAVGLLLLGFFGCSAAREDASDAARAAGDAPATGVPASPAKSQVAAVNFDWPHWRGPRFDGISAETDWNADAWPPEGRIAWKASIGLGFSSISTAAGRAYTMGHVEDDDVVWCFDADTGTIRWKQSYPAKLVANLHEGGPAATPTVDDDRVYTVSKEGRLQCLAVGDGAIVWVREFPREFPVKMPEWGFSCSPAIVGDLLIVDAGCAAAFDKHSGEVRWKTEAFRPGYGSPVPFEHEGQSCVAVLNNDALLVLRTADGFEVARFPWTTDYATSACTPIIDGETIFISTGYNKGCAGELGQRGAPTRLSA